MQFRTKAIHAGQGPEPLYGAVMPPVYQTSTFAFGEEQDAITYVIDGVEHTYGCRRNDSRQDCECFLDCPCHNSETVVP